MTLEEEVDGSQEEFKAGGATLTLMPEESRKPRIVSVLYSGRIGKYEIPPSVEANGNRIPGWFWAGIWDDMRIPHRNSEPSAGVMAGWNFSHTEKGFIKSIHNYSKQLLYNGQLIILNERGQYEHTIPYPQETIYHAIELFERNGWFDGEAPVARLDISAYKIID